MNWPENECRRIGRRACERVESDDVNSWTIHGLWPENYKGMGLCGHVYRYIFEKKTLLEAL